MRDAADAAWGMQQLTDDGETDPPGCEVYVTGSTRQRQHQHPQPTRGERESIELEERAQLLEDEEQRTDNKDDPAATSHATSSPHHPRRGRPPLGAIVDDVFGHDASDRVAVLVCGPTGLGKNLRDEVGRWVARGREVFWHGEEFGW